MNAPDSHGTTLWKRVRLTRFQRFLIALGFDAERTVSLHAGAVLLLPWQWIVLAWLCGLWFLRFPVPAVAGFLCLLFFRLVTSGAASKVAVVCVMIYAAAGGAIQIHYADAQLPVRSAVPQWVFESKRVSLAGTVESVTPADNQRVRVVLRDVQYRPVQKGQSVSLPFEESSDPWLPLAGNVVWTWDHPAVLQKPESSAEGSPAVLDADGSKLVSGTGGLGAGQRIALVTKVKPVRGFVNPGTWDSSTYWRDRGVLWRIWSRGAKTPIAVAGEASWLWNLRHALKKRVLQLAGIVPDKDVGFGSGNTAFSKTDTDRSAFVRYAAIIPALLFGDRSYMTTHDGNLLALGALSHSLALSGMHLGCMAGVGALLAWLAGAFFPSLFLRIPRQRLAVVCAAPLVLGYMWLGGFTPSLLRAGLMFGLWGVLLWIGHKRVILDGLFLAVLCLCLWNPLAIYDLRLQLSACAVGTLALVLPLLEWAIPRTVMISAKVQGQKVGSFTGGHAYMRRNSSSVLRAALLLFGVSASMQLGLAPLTIWNFGVSSPWFMLNIVWLPVLSLCVLPACLLGLLFVWLESLLPILSSACAAAAELCFSVARQPVAMLYDVLEWLEGVGAKQVVALRPHWLAILGCVLLMLGAVWLVYAVFARAKGRKRRLANSVSAEGLWFSGASQRWCLPMLLLGSALLLVPSFLRMQQTWEKQIRMRVIDVGQGQAVHLALPDGRNLLIDGGGFASRTFDVGKAVLSPSLAWREPPKVDAVFNSHPDTDHLRGLLYVLGNYSVKHYYGNGQKASAWNQQQLELALQSAGLQQEILHAGMALPLGTVYSDIGGKRFAASYDAEGVSSKASAGTAEKGVSQTAGSMSVPCTLMLEVLHPPARYPHASANNKTLVVRLAVYNGNADAMPPAMLGASNNSTSSNTVSLPAGWVAWSLDQQKQTYGLALIMGDIETKGIQDAIAAGWALQADVLVLPHHGARSAYAPQLYDIVNPTVAIASAGYLNRWKFPSAPVVNALRERRIPLFITGSSGFDRHGAASYNYVFNESGERSMMRPASAGGGQVSVTWDNGSRLMSVE